ncbi:MAG: fatty acid desaturase [Rhizobiales bacterium]|nr:fatty acid desaturase [Hyphomicrobiales bacterium]
MDHRAVLMALSAIDREELTGRADRPGLLRFAGHFGAILLVAALVLAKIPYWPLLMLPLGILIIFLFTALHETIHETAFRSPQLNRIVANICGFLVIVPPVWFRYFHFAHHGHTHDPVNDPELMSEKPQTFWQYAAHLSGIPYWIATAKTIAANVMGPNREAFVAERARPKVVREARIFVGLYGALFLVSLMAGSAALLWIWIVPVLLGQPFLRAYLLAEHARCPHVANMLENTRTTFTNNVVRFFAWNMPFHAEHHAYPTVPFHKLPQFHQIVREHLKTTEPSYTGFHRNFIRHLN